MLDDVLEFRLYHHQFVIFLSILNIYMRRHVMLTLVQIILAALKLLVRDGALRKLLCQPQQLSDRFDSLIWLTPIEVIVSTEISSRAKDEDANDVDEGFPARGEL